MEAANVLYTASVWIGPVLLAITFHEAAHGFVAWRLGDDTAKRLGRVTFNPLRHVDPFGTVILPGLLLLLRSPFLFGWAKPVPVRFERLNNPRRDMVLVAAAGPGINVLLAFAAFLTAHGLGLLPESIGAWLGDNLENAIVLNLVLAVFNMIPVPPLDGGRVAVGLLPPALGWQLARIEPYGLLLVILVFFLMPVLTAQLGYSMNPLRWLIVPSVEFLYQTLAILAGHV
jgi:Zn-dependent protease